MCPRAAYVVALFAGIFGGCHYAQRDLLDERCQTDGVSGCSVCAVGTRIVTNSCSSTTTCERVTGSDGSTCEVCRDANGVETASSCTSGCGVCNLPSCAKDERYVARSNECCPTCVASTACVDSNCPQLVAISCPAGQHAELDAEDCCRQICVLDACTGACTADDAAACAAGYHLEPTVAPCCRVCVADQAGCASDGDCDSGQTCRAGVCVAVSSCAPVAQPDPRECPGEWTISVDAEGCPMEAQCICPDGDPRPRGGFCANKCMHNVYCTDVVCNDPAKSYNPCSQCCPSAEAVCVPPPPACVVNEDCASVSSESECAGGYCTAAQVSGGLSLTSQTSSGRFVSYNGARLCEVPACRPDQVTEFGERCCPTCLDVCRADADCTGGKVCDYPARSLCAVQSCHLGTCSTIDTCLGVCR